MEKNQLEDAKAFQSSSYERMDSPLIMNQPAKQQYGMPPPQNRNSEYAADINQLKTKQSSCHCQAFIATFLLIVGQVTGLVLYFFTNVQLSIGALLGICIGSYVLYLIVACCCNPLSQYLSNISRGQNFERQYESVRKIVGHFVFHAECYHFQTRHHTRTVKDSNGNTRHQHYTTTEKVITHTATEFLNPTRTKDQSGSIDQIRAATKIVFIHYFINYRFVDAMSRMNFDRFYGSFKMRHNRDVHQVYTFKYDVPGFVERKAYFIGQLNCEYSTWYHVLGMIGLLWPYSLWVQSKISRFRVDSMKVLTI